DKPPEDRFRFLINNITLKDLREIWIDDHRFEGVIDAHGAFYVWPAQEFEIREAHFDLVTGRVGLHGTTVADDLTGTLFASVRLFPTPEKKGNEVFDFSSGLVALQGKLGRADFLNVYLQKLNWIHFETVSGEFQAKVRVFDGVIGGSSELKVKVGKSEARLAGTTIKGSGDLRWYRDDGNYPAILDLQLGKYEFIDPASDLILMTGGGLGLRVHTREPRLRNMWDQVGVHLELPPTEVHQLGFFNRFIPGYSGIEIRGGRATLKGILNVDSQGPADQSLFLLDAVDVNVGIGKNVLRGNVRIDARLKDTEEGDKVFDVSGSNISIDKVFSDADSGDWPSARSAWSGELNIEEGKLFDGKLSMKLMDLRPLLDVYSVRNRLAPWVKSVLRVRDVRAESQLKIGKNKTELRDFDVQSQGVDLKGWYKTGKGVKDGAVLVDLGIMNVGLDVSSSGTKVILLEVKDWFSKRERPQEN
ncbi:MAG: hypothetical protein ABL958_12285, partial [Bdellovibrionia bacterium]